MHLVRRVLLDQNLLCRLVGLLEVGMEEIIVAGRGWKGLKNGELLRVVQEEFDVLLTM